MGWRGKTFCMFRRRRRPRRGERLLCQEHEAFSPQRLPVRLLDHDRDAVRRVRRILPEQQHLRVPQRHRSNDPGRIGAPLRSLLSVRSRLQHQPNPQVIFRWAGVLWKRHPGQDHVWRLYQGHHRLRAGPDERKRRKLCRGPKKVCFLWGRQHSILFIRIFMKGMMTLYHGGKSVLQLQQSHRISISHTSHSLFTSCIATGQTALVAFSHDSTFFKSLPWIAVKSFSIPSSWIFQYRYSSRLIYFRYAFYFYVCHFEM